MAATASHMSYADAAFAKAIGRHDRRQKSTGARPRSRQTHNGHQEDTAGEVTAAVFTVKLLVYSPGTRDIDEPGARPVHVHDKARFFIRADAVAYAHWMAQTASREGKLHAYDVYERERKVYRAG